MSRGLSLLWWVLSATAAGAHSASDAYLNLTVDRTGKSGLVSVHGQWDVALRDLDFVLKLDDDGDGHVTWGEFERHEAAIERYVYSLLTFTGGVGNPCAIHPRRTMIDGHADGTYAALFFDVDCPRHLESLEVAYGLFFSVDPSHRGIFVARSGANVATAVFSPQNAQIAVTL